MGSEIGPLARDFTLIPKSLDEAQKIGDLIAKSGFAPKGYVGKPADVIIGIQMGLDVGLSPMQALQSIAVVNGRPSIYGDAAIGLVHRSGQLERLDAPEPAGAFDDALTATVIVKRRGQAEITRTFSVADAKRAKLWGKEGPWTNFPRRMLMMRARAFAIRDAFADVLLGLALAEESQDIEPAAPEVRVETVPLPRAIEAPVASPPAPAPPPPPEPVAAEVPAPPSPPPAPVPEPAAPAVDPRVARLPQPAEVTSDNSYLGKGSWHLAEVFQPIAGVPFWGIKTVEGLMAHTWHETVAKNLSVLVGTDHPVMFSGCMVEHPRAPLQVHGFTVVKAEPTAAQPPADTLKF